MSIAANIRQVVEDLDQGKLVADTKSMADYAARVARGQGHALRQRKMERGGWEIRVARGSKARRGERQSDLF